METPLKPTSTTNYSHRDPLDHIQDMMLQCKRLHHTTQTNKETKMTQELMDDLNFRKEILDRTRRTETKITNLINSLGMSLPSDGKYVCEVSVRNGVIEVLTDAADIPISSIKAAVIKAGFDLGTVKSIRIVIGGATFGYFNFGH